MDGQLGHHLGIVTGPVTEKQKDHQASSRRAALMVLLDHADSALTFMRYIQELGLEDELAGIVGDDNRLRILVARAREQLEFQLDEEGPSVETD